MTVEEFQEFVLTHCRALGVEYEASKERAVQFEGAYCSGYFADEHSGGPKLAYATGKPSKDWFIILVHEYNHMLQWSQKDPLWKLVQESDKYLWRWIGGEIELEHERAKKYVMANLRVELDCERRTLKMCGMLDLPIDPEWYVKKANSYVYFYHMVLKHRKWYEVGREPYSVPEIVSAMPDTLDGDYETISEEFVNLYETHLEYLCAPE